MLTNLFAQNLEIFLEADQLSGAGGDLVSSFTDQSGNARHFTGTNARPTIVANAVNGKKSVKWTRTNAPLIWQGAGFDLATGFFVLKLNSVQNYDGILSGITNRPLLVANHTNNNWFPLEAEYPYLEMRVNNRIYRSGEAPLKASEFVVLYFNLWQPVRVTELQLARDRDFSDREADFELAAMALYSKYTCEPDTQKVIDSFAHSYQIPIYPAFPLYHAKADTGEKSQKVLSDRQTEPTMRIKGGKRWQYDLSFAGSIKDYDRAENFFDTYFPGERFLFRNHAYVPPHDLVVRFDENSRFEDKGVLGALRRAFGFRVVESIVEPDRVIPPQPIFTGGTVLDFTPPTGVITYPAQNQAVSGIVEFQVDASDNVAVKRVEFYIAGALLGFDTKAPYRLAYNTDNLAQGTYTLDVFVYDTSENRSSVIQRTFTVERNDNAPPTGVSLTATAISDTLIKLAMAASDAQGTVAGYDLEFSLTGETPQAAPGTFGWSVILDNASPVANHNHAGRTASTRYWYRFRARDNNQNVSGWVFANAETLAAPDTTAPVLTPGAFTVTAVSSSSISVTYAATDNITPANAIRYDLQWSANGTTGWTNLLTLSTAASPYVHSGLTAQTQYFYRVRAWDDATTPNASGWSAVLNATTLQPGGTIGGDSLTKDGDELQKNGDTLTKI